jgi:hypothetical protein
VFFCPHKGIPVKRSKKKRTKGQFLGVIEGGKPLFLKKNEKKEEQKLNDFFRNDRLFLEVKNCFSVN